MRSPKNPSLLAALPHRRCLCPPARPSPSVRRPVHSQPLLTLAIKAEHPDRLWERRAPLVPDDVRQLLARFAPALAVKVEASQKRIFDDQAYHSAGAELVASGEGDGDVVIAIKEITVEHLHPRPGRPRTYCFFSHTHKGQSYNIPLLNRMVTSGDHFVDWELLVNPLTGVREVSFGRLAGVVGAGEALSGYGLFALKQGFSTPFLNLPRPYTFESTDAFFRALDRLRTTVARDGYRGPLVSVIVTGSTGRVGKGAVEVLDQAGVHWANDLDHLRYEIQRSEGLGKQHQIVGYKPRLDDYVVPHEPSQAFDRAQYNTHPDEFRSVFHERIAPWTTLLINGAYWFSGVPRLLSNSQLAHLLHQPGHRLRAVTDISCDFQGGLEFVERATTIEAPYAYFKADPQHSSVVETAWDEAQAALQLISIEILPSELAKDASVGFSSAILPYITTLVQSKLGQPDSKTTDMSTRLEEAMICGDGKLMPKHAALGSLLSELSSPSSGAAQTTVRETESVKKCELGESPRSVVVFGSGLVAKPAIETLLNDQRVKVTIGAKVIEEAQELSKLICGDDSLKQTRVKVVKVDAEVDQDGVEELVKGADVVVSLLPAKMHTLIAAPCLNHSVNLVTASYISPAMAALDSAAKERGLIFLNELGLDPGIDHMTAVRLIARLARDEPGSRVRSFVSFCGGLPETSDGVLGYRFSWSPRGVLEAMGNPARFRLTGKEYEIGGEELMAKKFVGVGAGMFEGAFRSGKLALEGVANRDSLKYIEEYGLEGDSLDTMMRGTLRFEGFCGVMDELRKIGLVRKEGMLQWAQAGAPGKWEEVFEWMGGQVEDGGVKEALVKLGLSPGSRTTHSADGLPPFPTSLELSMIAPIDLLCQLLSHKLRYGPGERDLVLLSHEIGLETSGGERKLFKAELVERGGPASSAMAKTVGSPLAIGALAVLDRPKGVPTGVVRPVEQAVWETVLERLENECALSMVERTYSESETREKVGGGLEGILASAVERW